MTAAPAPPARSPAKPEVPCPKCQQATLPGHPQHWVSCDKCSHWYHWLCVAPNPLDSLDIVDKWYCVPCVLESRKTPGTKNLRTTYKVVARKSSRSSKSNIDYANLDAGVPADAERYVRLLATRKTVDGNFKKFKAHEVTDKWLYEDDSFTEPFLFEEPEGLGLTMPNPNLAIQQISKIVGPKTPIEVIDVASQSSLAKWTLQQWADYYTDPKRDKVRNVISLEVSESPLSKDVVAPALVRQLDWVEQIWPESLKGPGEFPRVQKYCLMSVAKCWTDWHIDFAGSSVFYHVLRGAKTFYFIRPTKENLDAYEKWSGSTELQENTWLGDMCDAVYKVDLVAGNTMIIPTGWIHAVYTPVDTLVFGGNFLHSLHISTQLRVYAIELATKVPRKFRFPHFVKLLWFVADKYSRRLTMLDPSKATLPIDITPGVLEGLKELSAFLAEQTTRFAKNAQASVERRRIARENVPWEYVSDPVQLVRQLRTGVLKALGEPLDAACFPPAPDADVKMEEGTKANGRGSRAPSLQRSLSASSSRSTPAKRKADPAASPLDSRLTIRLKPTPPPQHLPSHLVHSNGHGSRDDGDVISRQQEPIRTTQSRELRLDPAQLDLGARWADVHSSELLNTVVRRSIDAVTGELLLETRTSTVKMERLNFAPRVPSPAPLAGFTPPSQPFPMPPTHFVAVPATLSAPPCSPSLAPPATTWTSQHPRSAPTSPLKKKEPAAHQPVHPPLSAPVPTTGYPLYPPTLPGK